MASILRSLSNAIVTTFDTVGDVGSAVQKSVHMATAYVDRAATAADIIGNESTILSIALELDKIQAELDGNVRLQAIFDEVAKQFKK